jgi:two-component system KDP operon response regulator KdpE
MRKRKILIVDDDRATVKHLQTIFNQEKFDTLVAVDYNEAIRIIDREAPDLVTLDLTLHGIHGLELCRQIREYSPVPIIMLSSETDQAVKVRCLDAGADDYVTKPFGNEELMARIRTAFRHCEPAKVMPPQPVVTFGNVTVDLVNRRVTVADREIKLTPIEYGLLRELVLNKGKVLTHKHILQQVWGQEYASETDYVHVFIRRLRLKLEQEPAKPEYLVSVSGIGYQLNC